MFRCEWQGFDGDWFSGCRWGDREAANAAAARWNADGYTTRIMELADVLLATARRRTISARREANQQGIAVEDARKAIHKLSRQGKIYMTGSNKRPYRGAIDGDYRAV